MIALMYHDVVPAGAEGSSGFAGPDADLYKVTPEMFEAHLLAIRGVAGRAPALAITFDDGGLSGRYAADVLERYGWRGYFFMTADYIGAPRFLDARALRDLHSRGHVVGSHSSSHPLRMGRCSPARIRDEWITSGARLSDVLGEPVRTASVPGGDYSRVVAEAAAEAGFTLLFTSEPNAASRPVGTVTVNGRFTIQRWTTPQTVAGLASGAWLPSGRQVLVWTAKKLTKRIAGRGYLQLRRLLLGSGNEMQWGDMR